MGYGGYTVCPTGQIYRADAGSGYGGCVDYYLWTGGTGNDLTGGTPGTPPSGSDRYSSGGASGTYNIIPASFNLAPLVVTGVNGQQVQLSPQAQIIFFVFFPIIALLLYLRKRR